jgi:hypothetical protein
MNTIEQKARGLVLDLSVLARRIEIETGRTDPHAPSYEGAQAHIAKAIKHLEAAISCLADPPDYNR